MARYVVTGSVTVLVKVDADSEDEAQSKADDAPMEEVAEWRKHAEAVLQAHASVVAERDALRAKVERMRPVVEQASRIRDGRYSIKSTLDYRDRERFDALNDTVDAYRAQTAAWKEE